MIILREINRTENSISAKYYPENQTKGGFLRISLPDGKVIEHIPDGEYYTDQKYPSLHAIRKLKELAQLERIPRESKILWY